MPKIQTYDSSISAQSPLPGRSPERLFAAPEDFGYNPEAEKGAKQLGEFGDTLDKMASTQDISNLQVSMAKLRASSTIKLQQAMTTPDALNDPDFSNKFIEGMADDFSKVQEGISTAAGQKYFDTQKAELSGDFLAKTGVYQVQLSGVKATQDFLTTLDTNRSTLVTDPSQFNSVLAGTEKTLNDPTGPYAGMPEEKRLELERTTKEQLALSAVEGLSRLSPQLAKKQIESGQWDKYVSGGARYQLDGIVDRAIMAEDVDLRRQQAANEKAEKAAAKKTEDGFVQTFAADPTKLSAMDVAQSNLPPEKKLEWIRPGGILDRGMGDKDSATYGKSFDTVFSRIHLPDGDPNKITNENQLNDLVGQGLTVSGYKEARQEIDSRTSQGGIVESDLKKSLLDVAKQQLVKGNQFFPKDPKGEEQYLRYQNWMLQEWQKQKDAGKSPADLTNPDSPEYLGKTIPQYARNPNQVMLDLKNANDPTAAAKAATPQGVDPSKVGSVRYNAKGEAVYLVDGKWVGSDGKPVK